MKKVLFIVGSLREKSFNRQLADLAASMLEGKVDISWLNYSSLPLINQDIEFPAPEEVTRVRNVVTEADALWIFTPEYNFSYPGHLKNLLDWLSRPLKPMDYGTPTCMAGKKVFISGVGGKAETANCRGKLTELLTFIRAEVQEPQTGIALIPECWASDTLLLTDEQRQVFETQKEAFLKIMG